jgi:tryptophan synthase alpha chain
MGRIEDRFLILKEQGKKVLITFVTAGDPDLGTTVRLVKEMEKQGADIIELGVPYSDPIAEGPVIQAANERALSKGIKVRDIMASVKTIREDVKVPLLYLLYFNSILRYGPAAFFKDCAEVGIDGVIIPDLPYEERWEIEEFADNSGVVIITLISPVSEERVEKIAKEAKGFVYCVSSLGVTGVRKDFDTDFNRFFSIVNKATKIPKALGFGVSTPEHIKALKGYCDGLIVGSAIVKLVGSSLNPDEAVKKVGSYINELRTAMDDDS